MYRTDTSTSVGRTSRCRKEAHVAQATSPVKIVRSTRGRDGQSRHEDADGPRTPGVSA